MALLVEADSMKKTWRKGEFVKVAFPEHVTHLRFMIERITWRKGKGISFMLRCQDAAGYLVVKGGRGQLLPLCGHADCAETEGMSEACEASRRAR